MYIINEQTLVLASHLGENSSTHPYISRQGGYGDTYAARVLHAHKVYEDGANGQTFAKLCTEVYGSLQS